MGGHAMRRRMLAVLGAGLLGSIWPLCGFAFANVEVGQRVQVFRVTDVEPGHQWTGVTVPKVFGRTAVTYAVEPDGPGSRLVCRITTGQRGPVAWAWSRLLAWGDLVMMRRQLLNLRDRAEGR